MSGRIARLGWNEEWQAARVAADATLQPVRIVAEHRGAYHASDGDAVAWVELTGRTYHRAADKRALPTVGDWVLVEHWDRATSGKGAGVIRHVRMVGARVTQQPLADTFRGCPHVDFSIVAAMEVADASGDYTGALKKRADLLES